MQRIPFARSGWAALLLVLLLPPLLAWAQAFEPLTIVTKAGQRHAFQVEVARNDADRAQGLMYRRSMAPDRGMLFVCSATHKTKSMYFFLVQTEQVKCFKLI